jgi:putative RNA ligase
MQAECFVGQNHNYIDFADHMLTKGFTPIFEWCSPQQQIVVKYPHDRLVLTAIRGTVNGIYIPYTHLKAMGESNGIDVVKTIDLRGILR